MSESQYPQEYHSTGWSSSPLGSPAVGAASAQDAFPLLGDTGWADSMVMQSSSFLDGDGTTSRYPTTQLDNEVHFHGPDGFQHHLHYQAVYLGPSADTHTGAYEQALVHPQFTADPIQQQQQQQQQQQHIDSSPGAVASQLKYDFPGDQSSMADEALSPASKKQRNRNAAAKCRAKNKMVEDELGRLHEEEKIRNTDLRATVDQLTAEALALKEAVLSHSGCNSPIIDNYLVREAQNISERVQRPRPGR